MSTSFAQRQLNGVSAGSSRNVAVGAMRSARSFTPAMPTRSAGAKASRVASSRSRVGLKVNAVIETPSMRYEPGSRANASSVLSIILGGGAGSRLYPLTKTRAKPAVPIGGAYRLIDVPMSNCINSGLNKVYILTQFNSTSLNRHLSRAYNMGGGVRFGGDGFVEVLSATQTPQGNEWFQGTADAVRQYCWMLDDTKNRSIEDVLILSGDHLYRMDYMKFVNYHREANADITLGCIAYDDSRAKEFGLMTIDENRRVTSFAEKPKTDEALAKMKVDTTVLGLSPEEAAEKPYIASMGIYVFKKEVLVNLLTKIYPLANDFGSEIIPDAAKDMNVVAYPFYGYWEDIGTIKSFFDENLKLCRNPSLFEFYDPQSPIYTSPRVLPPAHVEDSQVIDALIAQGAYVKKAIVNNAIIGLRAQIGEGCTIQDAMIMGADYYEGDEVRAATLARGGIPIGIGAGTIITNAIIDKNARIGKNCRIMNVEGIEEATRDDEGVIIRSGIIVVNKGTTIPDGTVI
eukprot:gene24142-9727_t